MTSPRTFVGFVANFPVDASGSEPAGKALAQFVHSLFVKAGLNSSTPADREGWAWEIHTRDGDLEVTTIVGLVDDMEATPPRQWLVTNTCRIPLLKRLFAAANSQGSRDRMLQALCDVLHTGISRDERFEHVLWYEEKSFDKPGDVPGAHP